MTARTKSLKCLWSKCLSVRLQRLALLILAWLILLPVHGAQQRAVDEYLIDSWETEQGLPENSATAMVQTPDGYLWFGTFNGLVRFDGVTFTVFDPANTPELPAAGIVNLHLDASGRLWVSTLQGLVVRDGSRWIPLWTATGMDRHLRAVVLGERWRDLHHHFWRDNF
ncbi:MAG: hypothetical protein EXS31_18235 [Pedosphaera sp.]|nr:hypothetical protein [Pedosphaera sp.]